MPGQEFSVLDRAELPVDPDLELHPLTVGESTNSGPLDRAMPLYL
jgi:hypothetical protein